MSPLSNTQKADIGIAARKAYNAWLGREEFELINSDRSRTACFEAWRHVEQGKAVGIQLLRECSQEHYNRLLAHFKELAGDADGAARQRGRDTDNDRRIARWQLDKALKERGLETGYAAKICWSKYKCALDKATKSQLWKLVFDIRGHKNKAPAKPIGEVPF